MIHYFARPDAKGDPEMFYRAVDETLAEEIYIQDQGWKATTFLEDMLYGSGDIGAITEKQAREAFPEDAFV